MKNAKDSIFQIEDIDHMVMGVKHQHPVLIYRPLEEMLEYLAVWLSDFQYSTAKAYASIFQRFCNYLINKTEPFDEEMLLSFWRYITVDEIKQWKTYRIVWKFQQNNVSPINSTIDREAQKVAGFLDWVKNEKGLNTLWDGKRKTISTAKAIHNDMLKGMAGPNTREVVHIDANVSFAPENEEYPIEGLARSRQSKPHEYLHDEQITILLNAFPDQVYKYICLTACISGLRDFEVLGVPYWKMYKDGTIFNSDPNRIRQRLDEEFLILKVLGKRDKLRMVKFTAESWLAIMEKWLPLYHERKKLYQARTGKELPLNILWLDKQGTPIFCLPQDKREHDKSTRKLQDAFRYISKQRKNNPLLAELGRKVDYYCLRHTYATNYVLRVMEARPECLRDQLIEDHSLRRELADQMGHNEIDMTFSKYVDNAIVVLRNQGGSMAYTFPSLDKLIRLTHNNTTCPQPNV